MCKHTRIHVNGPMMMMMMMMMMMIVVVVVVVVAAGFSVCHSNFWVAHWAAHISQTPCLGSARLRGGGEEHFKEKAREAAMKPSDP